MNLSFLTNFYSYYLFKKSDFSNFIATSPKLETSKYHTWVYFKLGMYTTVNSLPLTRPVFYYDLLAHAASYAACAHLQELKDVIRLFEEYFLDQIADLVHTLIPFNAGVALELATKHHLVALSIVALLLHQKQTNKANVLLQQLANQQEINPTNFMLLNAQLHFQQNKPRLILEDINQIFKKQNLKPLQQIDTTQPLSVTNITVTDTSYPVTSQQNHLISILITTYNCESYIAATLDSLLQQSYQNIELIIIDDCSNDHTWSILQDYAQKEQRIRNYQQSMNLGTYIAKNRALLLARGEFVMCHDSDDWSHPQRLERQIAPLLENEKLIATTSEWFRLSNEGEVYARSVFPISRLNPSSPLFRRKPVIKKLGFWDNVRTGADSEFLARIKLIFGKKAVHKIAIPLAIGSHHAQSLMNAPDTGFTDQVIPESRLTYWESWNKWHIEAIKQQTSLYVPLNPLLKQRKFKAPQSIVLDDQLLLQNQTIYQN